MARSATILFCSAVITMVTFHRPATAQSTSGLGVTYVDVPARSAPDLRSPSAVLATLFDQFGTSGSLVPNIQRFPDLGDAIREGADDFTVPAGQKWSVTGVNTAGIYWPGPEFSGVTSLVEVTIYTETAGLVGPPICHYPNLTSFTDSNGSFGITLSTPCKLIPGTYWLSVKADMPSTGRHFWGTNTTAANGQLPFYRQNVTVPGACNDWTAIATCIDPSISALQFQIMGDATLPVELTHFEAIANENSVTLSWETASETNNAGFEIQHRMGREGDFETVGFVEGHGTTDEARSYHFRIAEDQVGIGVQGFRLKQIDYDGAFEYSPVVEASVDLPVAYTLEKAYPNPFNPSTNIGFAVAESAPVSIRLYDVTGKLRRTLYKGTPTANEMHQVTVDGAGLPSGSYIVRLEGSGFVDSELIVLMK